MIVFSCKEKHSKDGCLSKEDEQLIEKNPSEAYAKLKSHHNEISQSDVDLSMRISFLMLKAKNKAFIKFDLEDNVLMNKVCKYYASSKDKHFVAENLYLLGRTYRDIGDAPMAVEALLCADSLLEKYDRYKYSRLLLNVRNELSLIYDIQGMHDKAIEEDTQTASMAKENGDTLSYLDCLLTILRTRLNMKENKYVADNIDKIVDGYLQQGDTIAAGRSSIIGVAANVRIQDWEKAKGFMDIYERYSGYVSEGQAKPGREIYYYKKGMIDLNEGKRDSAYLMFRELLNRTTDTNSHEMAYHGLLDYFKQTGEVDSALYYSELFADAIEMNYSQKMSDNIHNMTMLYDYSRNKSETLRKDEEIRNKNRYIIILLGSIIAIMLVGAYIHMTFRKKQEKSTAEALEKERKINDLQQRITQSENRMANMKEQLSIKQREEMVKQELQMLHAFLNTTNEYKANDVVSQTIDKVKILFPNFEQNLKKEVGIFSAIERDVCALIKIGLKQHKIALLLSHQDSAITNVKTRLFERRKDKSVEYDDINKWILSLFE